MSIIAAGNTTTTALVQTADTTGNLVFNTGGANTTALTLSNTQAATFANNVTISGTSTHTGNASFTNVTASGIVTATGGVVVGASAAPAFSVSLAGTQTLANAVTTKLVWDTEEYDTNNNFASNRFTPTVAGYYQLTWSIYNSTASVNQSTSVYKNGVLYKQTSYMPSTTSNWLMFCAGLLVYMNGTTDYIELYASYQTGGVVGNNSGTPYNWFQGFLARSA